MKATLTKMTDGGFAYSAHEKIVKLEIRPAKNGWFFEERSGARGGSLTETSVVCKNEKAAIEMLNKRIAAALADGYLNRSES